MNPISNTAYMTCGARAEDAQSNEPICGDIYASRFLDEHGRSVYDRFRKENRPVASFVARHRMIDDILRAKISENGHTAVVIIGAGFDTRAFRLGGGVWFELDEPQIIEAKDRLLPVEQCRNPVQRIPIDFTRELLADKLPAIQSGTPVVVVMEGIFNYLTEPQIRQTLSALEIAFPRCALICDITTRHFMEQHGKSLAKRIESLGATLHYLVDDPSELFRIARYRLVSSHSIIVQSLDYTNAKVARFIVSTFIPKLANGYKIYLFDAPVA